MLSSNWDQRKSAYDFVVIGSGYGGAISAARIATSNLAPKPSLCILERGKEWPIGTFPDRIDEVIKAARDTTNPLGLYEFINYRDISVIKGSGLGGTSLVNANVAIVPDADVFKLPGWPRSISLDVLQTYYDRARSVIAPSQHPRAMQLAKVQALDRRAQEIGKHAFPLHIAVNFTIDGANPHGVEQKPCIDCGDCITGCNVGAKNTMYMNYLPIARNAGAEIYTQNHVDWIEKLDGGGWRIHGRHYIDWLIHERFTIDAKNVMLSAGAINSPEILLRSEMHGLSVSPMLGTAFSGNGDFFGLAYNGDYVTNVLGYGLKPPIAGEALPSGPTIVGAISYSGDIPVEDRFTVEDLSFPNAYILGAKALFGALQGHDTVTGNEAGQRQRLLADADVLHPYRIDGALNHTMFYLVMGHDDSRGTMVFDAPWYEPEGRMKIEWDGAGREIVFTRINAELRRNARALRANFLENPMWGIFKARHLITAHPLGGCPMGEDYLHGAVDEFGRVFAGDGSAHEGLYVSDGSLIPSALNVNPFLTISALTERNIERKIRDLQGDRYPAPNRAVSVSAISPIDVIEYGEDRLEQLFRRCATLGIDVMMNQGGAPQIDIASRTIRNDRYWKGFFPKGHVLNAMSSALFTSFKKEFHKQDGRYTGVTSDTDGHIKARNSLEEITLDKDTGTLTAGHYILLRYLDFPWTGYYDIFKVINPDLLIGRVYLGEYPHGVRLITFSMARKYSFDQMTVDDHAAIYAGGSAPSEADLQGVWRMDAVTNANHASGVAYLQFDAKPDGQFQANYELMGLMEGIVVPSFVQDHFQMNDFTPFHDEIRKITDGFMLGKYVTAVPGGLPRFLDSQALGLLHTEPNGEFGFCYMISKTDQRALPTNTLLRPFLDVHLPDGLGMTFAEEMVGWYFEGATTPAPGRDGDLTIANRIPASGVPVGVAASKFDVRMTIEDLNEFIDGAEHEASISGTISFDRFQGQGPAVFTVDSANSRFNYLEVNPDTGEAEMRYHIEFRSDSGRRFIFEGRKYLQRDGNGGVRGLRDLLRDFTTLYVHISESKDDGTLSPIGIAYMKFRTFENLAAIGNMTGFLASFKVTGTSDPALQLQGQMRFLAFTAQFVQREYAPLSLDQGGFAGDVQQDVLRGASTPDFFSTRPSTELQAILRDTPTLPIEKLINTGAVRFDFEKKRIFRDSFWKGSFAKDTLLGWEERIRTSLLGPKGVQAGSVFAGGSFWKRFDRVENGVATGYVVNYEVHSLPGEPMVRQAPYPDDNRRYFKKGDPILLLNYINEPYKIVYDTIKVIDDDNALGVMHLGTFPNGIEFATFVMARNNYPFEKMSVEDHDLLFADPRARVPTAPQLEGEWDGSLVFVTHPNTTLLNQLNPVVFHISFNTSGTQVQARYRFGLISGGPKVQITEEFVELLDPPAGLTAIKMIDADTMIGKCVSAGLNPSLLTGLRNFLEPASKGVRFRYVLTRMKS